MNLLRGPKPMTPYDCQFLRDRLRGKVYLPLAYFEGATPENGYQPCVPYTLNVLADPRPQDIEPGYMRVFLKTSGADSPRPMKLRQKASTGEWFPLGIFQYSQRYPYSRGGRSVGIVSKEKGVQKMGLIKAAWCGRRRNGRPMERVFLL